MRTRLRAALPLLLVAAVACAAAGGSIPPSKFVFRNVVPYKPPGEGGWKTACVDITFVKPAIPQAWTCSLEVGVPEVNVKGPVETERAQTVAARATTKVARDMMNHWGPVVVGTFCINLQRQIREEMAPDIPGVRTNNACKESRAWATSFP